MNGMPDDKLNIVTGALGFSGKYITRRLLSEGQRVRTLTGHPDRPNEFGGALEVTRLSFDDPQELAESMRGATTLYNTYWIRFAHGDMTFDKAIENSRTLITAARDAGVSRVVHISITNPSEDSALPYFRGKAVVERAIIDSGLSYAILRPTVLFGAEGILINNIAWCLRRLPVFAIPGSGEYRVQPIFVEDLAELAVSQGDSTGDVVVDAVGPEIWTFNEFVRLIADTVHSRTIVTHVPAGIALLATRMLGAIVGDVVLTKDEIDGLEQNLLVSEQPPLGQTRLSDWLSDNADRIGSSYFSELKRHR